LAVATKLSRTYHCWRPNAWTDDPLIFVFAPAQGARIVSKRADAPNRSGRGEQRLKIKLEARAVGKAAAVEGQHLR
jgi:hypothetical protein